MIAAPEITIGIIRKYQEKTHFSKRNARANSNTHIRITTPIDMNADLRADLMPTDLRSSVTIDVGA